MQTLFLCPKGSLSLLIARGVGGDHLSRFAVLPLREDGSTLAPSPARSILMRV